MGSHTNFYFLILSMLRIKDEFYRIKSSKLLPLIDLLKTKRIEWVDECEEVPSNKELAKELGITVTRCNTLLKNLQESLIEDFNLNKSLETKEVVHEILIMPHYEEWQLAAKLPNWTNKSFSMRLNLKSTPRVGEHIEFESVPANHYYMGMVHDVRHKIEGKTQIIQIWVHPWENEYRRWIRQKDE